MNQDLGLIYFFVVFFALLAHHSFKRKLYVPAAVAATIAGYLAWHNIPGVPGIVGQGARALHLPVGAELMQLSVSLLGLAVVCFGLCTMFSPRKAKKKKRK